MKEIYRFRFLLSRQIKQLANFNTQRTTDRRLKLLVENQFLTRKKVFYGIASFYQLTHKARVLIHVNKREDKIKLEQVRHDIFVVDTAIYFINKLNISSDKIQTEKELHSKDGFSVRQHVPDFVIFNSETVAIEIELTEKTKERLEKNLRDNFLNYDKQIWIVEKNSKIEKNINDYLDMYPNIKVIFCNEIEVKK